MRSRKLFIPIAAGALFVAPLAACNDDDNGDSTTTTTVEQTTTTMEQSVDEEALQRVTDASEATIDEGTASFRVQAYYDDGSGGTNGTDSTDSDSNSTDSESNDSDSSGSTNSESDDSDSDDSDSTGSRNGEGVTESEVDIEGVVDFDADQRRLTFVGPGGELDIILDGATAYIELPATEDDDWAAIDLDTLLDTQVGVGGPAALPFQDPADNLRVLEGNVTHASEEGSEQIDGEDTDHYRLVIDLESSVDEASDDIQDALRETVQRTGAEELEMHVWIDDDDLIRRVQYSLDLDQLAIDEDADDVTNGSNNTDAGVQADPEGTLVVVFDYSDFGDDVDIELPDDENIINIDEEEIRNSLGLDESTSGTGTTTTTTGSNDDDDDNDNDDTTTTTGG